MNTTVHKRNIPTEIYVDMIRREFPDIQPFVNKIIEHRRLEQITGLVRTTNLYRAVVWRWREWVERQTGLWIDGKDQEAIQAGGFKVLANAPLLRHSQRKAAQAAGTSARAARRAAASSVAALTAEEQRLREHIMQNARAAQLMLLSAPLQIAAETKSAHSALVKAPRPRES